MRLFSNRSQQTSKCGKKISDTLRIFEKLENLNFIKEDLKMQLT